MGSLVFPKSVRFLPFQPYDPENSGLKDAGIWVWVDPPRAFLVEYDQIQSGFAAFLQAAVQRKPAKTKNIMTWLSTRLHLRNAPRVADYHHALYDWYARLWSQGPEDTHWTVEELDQINEHNPDFLEWLFRSSMLQIAAHRTEIKKGWRPPEPNSPLKAPPATQS
jgi:hypothetical protein